MKKINKLIILSLLLTVLVIQFLCSAVFAQDTLLWEKNLSMASESLCNITYGKNLFVAVGADGEIKTSPDGKTWTRRSTGISDSLFGIVWNGSCFVTVGSGGAILKSDDGIEWEKSGYVGNDLLYNVVWGKNQFVAVGMGTILTSSDGVSWLKSYSDKFFKIIHRKYGTVINI